VAACRDSTELKESAAVAAWEATGLCAEAARIAAGVVESETKAVADFNHDDWHGIFGREITMLAPSPVGFDPGRLEEYGEIFQREFNQRDRPDLWFVYVIQFFQSGYNVEDVRTMTGYTAAFIDHVAQRFAEKCQVHFCRQHHRLLPCECGKTKEEK
jgi:hypothetical protein